MVTFNSVSTRKRSLLTAEEERTAFNRIVELRQPADAMVPENERELQQIRSLIVESNLRLVFAIAKRYANANTDEFDEFVSIGNAALVRAVDLFDPERGWRFSTYAYKAIQRSIFGFYRQEQRRRGRAISEDISLSEVVVGDDAHEERELRRAMEIKQDATRLMKRLDERDRKIVMSRFGINRRESGLAFRKIASEIGISTTRTVQLFHRSIERMRQTAEEMKIDQRIEAA